MRMNLRKTQSGFTLIELLVVLAIIGLLSSILATGLIIARKKSRDTQRISNMEALRTALDMYYQDIGTYPITAGWQGTACGANYITGLTPNYLTRLPKDPTCGGGTCTGGTSKDFLYQSNGTAYKLIIDGCFETNTYTAIGKPFNDPARSGLPQFGAVYNTAGAGY